jgi:hypothetical protein
MDISETLAPTSDQLDAIELIAGPRTFTIESVSAGSPEQPVQIKLAEFPRVWRPSKGMRRVLAAGWGVKATEWTGRRVTLYFDPDVTFGKDRTGGTRISHMSDLPNGRPLNVPLLITRGKSAIFVVKPLVNEPTPAPDVDYQAEAAAATDLAGWRKVWQQAKDAGHLTEALKAQLMPIGEALKAEPAPEPEPPADDWPATATIPGTSA